MLLSEPALIYSTGVSGKFHSGCIRGMALAVPRVTPLAIRGF